MNIEVFVHMDLVVSELRNQIMKWHYKENRIRKENKQTNINKQT